MIDALGLTSAELDRYYRDSPEVRALVDEWLAHPVHQFQPRPDDHIQRDYQSSFMECDADFVTLLGGTGSGKTIAAAVKTARKVLFESPPEPELPFWVIGQTYDLVCGVCWKQKLANLIPQHMIRQITWVNRARGWPASVLLKDPNDLESSGWELVFRSYDQGRERMQAYSIGGYWFNEECPLELVYEVQGRCREHGSPGWADFTPLSMNSFDWKNAHDDPPDGWEFFHLNTLCNQYLAEGWAERYLANVPDDMRSIRQYGDFGQMEGLVYKEWNRQLHVIDPAKKEDRREHRWLDPDHPEYGIPEDWIHFRSFDFGFNNPFVCVWMARDRDENYYVYDVHYARQKLLAEHAEQIKKRRWLDHHPWWRVAYADPSAAQERKELVQLELPTRGARNALTEGIEAVRMKMKPQPNGKPQFYVLSHCKEVIREIEQYHWDIPIGVGLRERDPMDRPVPKDDHTLDAIRYVIYSEELDTANFSKGVKRDNAWKAAKDAFF